MHPVTIKDYQQFLVAFQKANPQLEIRRFGIDDPHNHYDKNDCKYLADALIETNWEELTNYWEEYDDHWTRHQTHYAYVSGKLKGNRSGFEPDECINLQQIADVKAFDMVTAYGQIAYLVLLLKDGTFRLSDYIGD